MIDNTLLKVEDLKVHFDLPRPKLLASKPILYAVDGVSFDVTRSKTLGIVGESGCGKSTTGLAILQLLKITEGKVFFDGTELVALSKKELQQVRKRMQIIFQDPYSSLNPRQTSGAIVREPLDIQKLGSEREREERVSELFSLVGLLPNQKVLFPHQFSGGQRQRIGIARALALNPDLIVCDEPVSALDVAIQAQILNLLIKLQEKLNLTYLFISHDLGVVHHICDEIAVMYMGKIVEKSDRFSLFNNPLHPYTQALLSSIPSRNPTKKGLVKRIQLHGDLPNPVNRAIGCSFQSRCSKVMKRCTQEEPSLDDVSPGHRVACHLF